MTAYFGYVESPEKIAARWERIMEQTEKIEVQKPVQQLQQCGHPYTSIVMDANTGETSCYDCKTEAAQQTTNAICVAAAHEG